jgi:hypothetical protein
MPGISAGRSIAAIITVSDMANYNFTIIAAGVDHEAEDFEDRLFDAGCDDATISVQKGAIVLEFSRASRNFTHALVSAVKDVQRAGARVDHIEPDYLVSLSDIAKRADVSRASISLYAKGERGDAFPAPVARVTTESPLWDWFEVARWMFRRRTISRTVVVEAKIVREANLALMQPRALDLVFVEALKAEEAA